MSSPALLAVVCARNEALQIEWCLRNLIGQGFEVILIDHSSDDNTVERAQEFVGQGLLRIEHLVWHGYFSLSDQLRCKQAILLDSTHDWVAHFDVDEAPQAIPGWKDLRQVVLAADAAGFNCINFDEMVLLPPPDQVVFQGDAFKGTYCDYYFFQPTYPRLMRLWRRDAGFTNLTAGGHCLKGDSNLYRFPQDQLLKHYIVLSREAAFAKYLPRVFSSEDLDRGWHGNRVNITKSGVEAYFAGCFQGDDRLRQLTNAESKVMDRSAPQTKHFWEWC